LKNKKYLGFYSSDFYKIFITSLVLLQIFANWKLPKKNKKKLAEKRPFFM